MLFFLFREYGKAQELIKRCLLTETQTPLHAKISSNFLQAPLPKALTGLPNKPVNEKNRQTFAKNPGHLRNFPCTIFNKPVFNNTRDSECKNHIKHPIQSKLLRRKHNRTRMHQRNIRHIQLVGNLGNTGFHFPGISYRNKKT